MPEPSLSELASVPIRATGKPATVIDNSQMVAQLNQNARFRADNDWKRYQQFLANFQDLSKNAQAIAAMDVMPQDRDYLDKQRAKVFDIVSKNPKALSGTGPAAIELNQAMSKYTSEATRSKQDSAFDWAHRQLLGQKPEWSTDENRGIIDKFAKQPLGSREQYTLKLPYQVDMGGLLQGVFKDPTVAQTTYGWEQTPDGKFIQEKTTTTLKHDAFMNRWNSGLSYGTDINHRPLKGYAQQLFDELPDSKKSAYIDKDGKPDLNKFWGDVGETMFGSQQDILKTEKGKLEPNRFMLDDAKEKEKFIDDLKKMQVKFGYDMQKLQTGEGFKERYRTFSQDHPLSKTGKWLNDQTASLILGAQSNGKSLAIAKEGGGWSQEKEVNWDPQIKHLFDEEQTFAGKVIKKSPDLITVDPDGNIRVMFYKDKAAKTNDPSLTKVISPDDFKALLANKFKLTGALELSNEDMMDKFGTPSLNGNVLNYWQQRTQNQDAGDGGKQININDVPTGTKLEKKGSKYYYNGKEVIM